MAGSSSIAWCFVLGVASGAVGAGEKTCEEAATRPSLPGFPTRPYTEEKRHTWTYSECRHQHGGPGSRIIAEKQRLEKRKGSERMAGGEARGRWQNYSIANSWGPLACDGQNSLQSRHVRFETT